METYKILDREYPVTGYVTAPGIGTVPLVDLPMMSDERWEELCREGSVRHYAAVFGCPPESVETAMKWEQDECARAIQALKAEGKA